MIACARPNEPHYVFHYQFGIPGRHVARIKSKTVALEWSQHAIDEVHNDRYGVIQMPDTINTAEWYLIETKESKRDRQLDRVLLRSEPDEQGRCACLVLAVRNPNKWRVVTCWVNVSNDNHSTLRRDRYDDPRI